MQSSLGFKKASCKMEEIKINLKLKMPENSMKYLKDYAPCSDRSQKNVTFYSLTKTFVASYYKL